MMKTVQLALFTLALFLGASVVTLSQITPDYTFSNGQTISSSQMNSNFSKLGDALNRTGGTVTGTITSSGGSLTGSWAGAPTWTGAPTFSGTPTFSGAVTLSGGGAISGTWTGTPTLSNAWTFSAAPTFSAGVNTASDTVFTANAKGLRRNTSDGSDSGTIYISGGGAVSDQTRGGYVEINGNEAGRPGYAEIVAGNVTGSKIEMRRADGNYAFTLDGATGNIAIPYGQVSYPAAQNASTDANTLDDYEEGTCTPTDASGASLTLTSVECLYEKIGTLVHVALGVTYPNQANGSAAVLGSLPFTSRTGGNLEGGCAVIYTNSSQTFGGTVPSNATTVAFAKFDGTNVTNANLSLSTVRLNCTYRAAS